MRLAALLLTFAQIGGSAHAAGRAARVRTTVREQAGLLSAFVSTGGGALVRHGTETGNNVTLLLGATTIGLAHGAVTGRNARTSYTRAVARGERPGLRLAARSVAGAALLATIPTLVPAAGGSMLELDSVRGFVTASNGLVSVGIFGGIVADAMNAPSDRPDHHTVR